MSALSDTIPGCDEQDMSQKKEAQSNLANAHWKRKAKQAAPLKRPLCPLSTVRRVEGCSKVSYEAPVSTPICVRVLNLLMDHVFSLYLSAVLRSGNDGYPDRKPGGEWQKEGKMSPQKKTSPSLESGRSALSHSTEPFLVIVSRVTTFIARCKDRRGLLIFPVGKKKQVTDN